MNWVGLAYIGVAIIIPIIPAYLLYRLLPSDASVDGPWQGLRIKLGGAFAGYFVLVVTVLAFIRTSPSYEVWTVRGQLRFSDDGGIFDERSLLFHPRPSRITVSPDGRFEVPVLSVPDVSSGMLQLPTLVLDQAFYQPEWVDLDSLGVRDHLRKRIDLIDVIVLRPDPTADRGHDR